MSRAASFRSKGYALFAAGAFATLIKSIKTESLNQQIDPLWWDKEESNEKLIGLPPISRDELIRLGNEARPRRIRRFGQVLSIAVFLSGSSLLYLVHKAARKVFRRSLIADAIVLSIISAIYYANTLHRRIYYKELRKIPSLPLMPFIGHIHANEFGYIPLLELTKVASQIGPITTVWVTPTFPVVVILHPDPAHYIYKNSPPKAFSTKFFREFLGKGLITSDGAHWKKSRKLLTPAFHFEVLQEYFKVMLTNASLLLEKLQKASEEKASSGALPVFDVGSMLFMWTFDIIAECACGVKANAQSNEESEFCKAVTVALETVGYHMTKYPYIPPKIWFLTESGRLHLRAVKKIKDICATMIESRKSGLTGKSAAIANTPKDFLDILLTSQDNETGEKLSDNDVMDEVITFIFAGHDTSATSLQYALFNIMTHPDVESKVVEEINRIIGEKDMPSYDDLKGMSYLDHCLKESMRLYTTVPILGRRTDKPLQMGQYTIPENVEIAIVPFAIHRNPQVWESPDSYDPDRFSVERSKGRHPFAFVPFSAGQRNCLGQNFAWMEMKLILSLIIRNFHLRFVDPCAMNPEPYVVLRLSNGLKANIVPRRKSHDH